MAEAFFIGFDTGRGTINEGNPALVDKNIIVIFTGADVQGGTPDERSFTMMGFDPSASPNTIAAFIAAAIRTQATALGYTIAVNHVTLPSFAKG